MVRIPHIKSRCHWLKEICSPKAFKISKNHERHSNESSEFYQTFIQPLNFFKFYPRSSYLKLFFNPLQICRSCIPNSSMISVRSISLTVLSHIHPKYVLVAFQM